jgi:hypothetical protein
MVFDFLSAGRPKEERADFFILKERRKNERKETVSEKKDPKAGKTRTTETRTAKLSVASHSGLEWQKMDYCGIGVLK